MRISKTIAVTALVGAALVGLTACAASDSNTPAPSTTAATKVAPIVTNIDELEGTTVELSSGNSLDIVVPADQVIAWGGSSSDDAVASFLAGSSGTAVTNPSVTAGKAGTAQITLMNGDQKINFTVKVH